MLDIGRIVFEKQRAQNLLKKNKKKKQNEKNNVFCWTRKTLIRNGTKTKNEKVLINILKTILKDISAIMYMSFLELIWINIPSSLKKNRRQNTGEYYNKKDENNRYFRPKVEKP